MTREVGSPASGDEPGALALEVWTPGRLGSVDVNDVSPPEPEHAHVLTSYAPPTEHRARPRPRTLDRYVKDPALSPDGRLLACIVVEQDLFPFALQMPLDDDGVPIVGEEREVRLPVEGGVRRVLYSPDGHWLACEVAPDGGDREQIWFVTSDPDDANSYTVDLAAYETVELVSWDDDFVAVSVFDREGTVEGRLFNPVTGETRVVDRRTGGALTHSRGNVSLFRVGSRGNRELLAIDDGGTWRPLMPVDNGSTTDRGFVTFDGDRPSFIVRSDHSAERFRLLRLTPTEHAHGVEVLLEREDADVQEFAVSLDGSVAAVLWNDEGWCDLQIVDLTGGRARVVDLPELPSLIATTPSLTADGSLLALTVAGPEFPPTVVVYDVAARRWVGDEFRAVATAVDDAVSDAVGESVAENRPREGGSDDEPAEHAATGDDVGASGADALADEDDLDTMSPARPTDGRGRPVLSAWGEADIIPELLHYEARDGMRLSGWLYRAVGPAPSEPAPTIVYFHGGPEGQARPDYNNVLRKLAATGHSVFLPNVRGSAGRGRRFSQADDRYGRFAAIDDAEDTLDHLIDAGITRDGQAVIMGRSYGGYLVHASLTRHAGRWAGGIAACGMSDLETFYRDTDPWIASAAMPKYGDPKLDRHLLAQASPLRQFSRVDVPVMFIHGQLDSNVPVSEAYQAMGVLASRGVPTEMLLFPDEGHEFERLNNRWDMEQRVLAFCERIFDE